MSLDAKSFALSGGIMWGLGMFVLTLLSLWTGYAAGFLALMAIIYPGYSISFVGSLVGMVYGFVDCFVGLYVFAWLYNRLSEGR